MRRALWGLGVLGALALGVGLGVKPAVRALAAREAARRGFELQVAEVDLRWNAVALRGVHVRTPPEHLLECQIDRVTVRLVGGLAMQMDVLIQGARLRVHGSLDDIRKRLRPSAPSEAGSGGSSRRRFLQAREVSVEWTDPGEGEGAQKVEGGALDDGPGGLRVGARQIHGERGNFLVDLYGIDVTLEKAGGERNLTSALLKEVRLRYRATGDVGVPSASAALPSGVKPPGGAPGLLERFGLKAGRADQLGKAVEWIRSELGPRAPKQMDVERVWLSFEKDGDALTVGPAAWRFRRESRALRMELDPGQGGAGTPLGVRLDIPLHDAPMEAALRGGPIALKSLGIHNGDFGLSGVESTELSGNVLVLLHGPKLQVDGALRLENLLLESPKVSPDPLYVPPIDARGQGTIALDGTRLDFPTLELGLGGARFKGKFGLERGEDFVVLRAGLGAPLVSCSALLDATPKGLLGQLEGTRLSGTFSFDASVDADTRNLGAMGVHVGLENGCHIDSVPESLDPRQFRGPFTREVLGPGDLAMPVESGPGSALWVPYAEISPYLEAALLTSEDGRFYSHHGFDLRAMESSIRDNTRAGSFVRGASTLTMQLAKNLYLTREKTLARKIKELLLTVLLEQEFSKRELLELYMNVVEFGPGVYGVKRASEYYFATIPERLTLAQCFFLASVLPSPLKQRFGLDGVQLSPSREYVEKLLRIAAERGRISPSELDGGLKEKLVLGVPGALPAPGLPLPTEAPLPEVLPEAPSNPGVPVP